MTEQSSSACLYDGGNDTIIGNVLRISLIFMPKTTTKQRGNVGNPRATLSRLPKIMLHPVVEKPRKTPENKLILVIKV